MAGDDGTTECAECSGDGAIEVCTIAGCGQILDNCPHGHEDGANIAIRKCDDCDGFGYTEDD